MPGTSSLWGLLLNSGMITIVKRLDPGYYQIRIPNKEVRSAFIGLTEYALQIQEGSFSNLFGALRQNDVESFIEQYRSIIETLPSYHDLKDENSYHMMMLGICIMLPGDYDINSNREWGEGRNAWQRKLWSRLTGGTIPLDWRAACCASDWHTVEKVWKRCGK